MKNKRKIDWFTIVTSDTFGGGAEQHQINMFHYLVNNGKNCYVICLSKRNMGCWDFMEKKGTVKYLPFGNKYVKFAFLLLFPILLYVFLTKKISYSFSTQTLINSSIGFYKRLGFLKKTKIIVRESNSIFKLMSGLKLKRYVIGYKVGYPKVDLVICQTEFMKNQLIEGLPWLAKKVNICVIDNPINLEIINQKASEDIDGLNNTEFIVAAGSLHPKKGFDILIDSFSQFHMEYPSLKLYILGEGEKRKELTEQIKLLKLEDKIVLKGFTNNVYPYFKYAKLCVMSSRIEGFPNVLLQMMSQNHKVVSTLSAGGIDNIEGLITCPVLDAQKLKKAMIHALNTNTEKNRESFDLFLEKRNYKSFIDEIVRHLN
ncbi:glycosyltransferase [Confluentibacter flavum]|uniref:Uncharacterized protein n=1 Tax=Confluentibacter flavum TaxID=1909700 RepID=A0A2N3HGH1_9FLAO|nr:glycosyltransferase [Confluentibacter flavum]PKQ44069.1 hypothetical protein CSW08_14805 [Confluentibacter flavum]